MKVLNSKTSNEILFGFTHGVDLDCQIYHAEIKVQKAWTKQLSQAGYLEPQDTQKVLQALDQALIEMQDGSFEWRVCDEDIHMNLERYITEKLGPLGKKIHLGRSRNDLIATTLKVTVADHLKKTDAFLVELINAFITNAEKNLHVAIPGMTHLQNGQPVKYSHVLLAHAQGFARDLDKVRNCIKSVTQTCPLGSAALAGTHIDIDLEALAEDLGFQSAALNSYDEVMNRDFIVDALAVFSSIALHLSRFSEDVVLWNSAGFQLINLSHQWSTGSSIMPNKRNPDVAEISRAKSAHIISSLCNSLVLLKALPSGYNTDLHELKRTYLQSWQNLQSIFAVLPNFVANISVNTQSAENLLMKGHILATEITNHLAEKGVHFRDAYSKIVEMIEHADKNRCQIHQLDTATAKTLSPQIDESFWQSLSFNSAIEARNGAGGTSAKQVSMQIAKLKELLSNKANYIKSGI